MLNSPKNVQIQKRFRQKKIGFSSSFETRATRPALTTNNEHNHEPRAKTLNNVQANFISCLKNPRIDTPWLINYLQHTLYSKPHKINARNL